MFRRFAKWYLSRLPCQDIGDGRGSIFFNRYTILKTRRGAIYLHQFFRGDSDRCLHDHPWPFSAIILWGGYVEEMFSGPLGIGGAGQCYVEKDSEGDLWELAQTQKYFRPAGTIIRRSAGVPHRIVSIRPGTWSLVVVGRRCRAWGFFGPYGWIRWRVDQPNPICETNDIT